MAEDIRMIFMNTYIDNVCFNSAIELIDDAIKLRKKTYLVTPNVDVIVKIERNDELKKIVNNADFIFADGKPLLWISWLYGEKIKSKISGSDLLPAICKLANKKNYRVFLFGAKDGVAKKASENLQHLYKNLIIAGYYSPKYGFENDSYYIDNFLSVINESNADVLVLGLGFEKEAKFIKNYFGKLKVPLIMCLGASIDFAAGAKRAPVWMQRTGFEWFYRLLHEPCRLWKRYFLDLYIIVLLIKYFPIRKKINNFHTFV